MFILDFGVNPQLEISIMCPPIQNEKRYPLGLYHSVIIGWPMQNDELSPPPSLVPSLRQFGACAENAVEEWRVSVIRTVGWATAQPDVRAIPPGPDAAGHRHSPFCMIGLTLGGLVPALRILGPIPCETIANQPFAEIHTGNRTRRHRTGRT